MGPPWGIDPTTHCTMSKRSYHPATSCSLHQSWSTGWNEKQLNGTTTKDRPDDPSHHERTLLPRSYILLPTPVVEHWLEREIAQWVHHEGSIRPQIAPWANALTTELHLAPYTSHGALAGARNSSMGQPWRIDPTIHHTMSERSYHGATNRSLHQSWLEWEIAQWVHHEGLIWPPIAPWANALTTELHLAPTPTLVSLYFDVSFRCLSSPLLTDGLWESEQVWHIWTISHNQTCENWLTIEHLTGHYDICWGGGGSGVVGGSEWGEWGLYILLQHSVMLLIHDIMLRDITSTLWLKY